MGRLLFAVMVLTAGRDAEAVTSNDTWQSLPLPTQEGVFQVEMEITPSAPDADGVVGLSAGSVTQYQDLAAIWRFDAAGFIDVRDDARYRADVAVVYSAGTTYHVRATIDVPNQMYSVWVTPAGESEIALATDYVFRSEQQGVTALSSWGTLTTTGTMEVVGFASSSPPGDGGDSDIYRGAISAGCGTGEYYDFATATCERPVERGCTALGRRSVALLVIAWLLARRSRLLC